MPWVGGGGQRPLRSAHPALPDGSPGPAQLLSFSWGLSYSGATSHSAGWGPGHCKLGTGETQRGWGPPGIPGVMGGDGSSPPLHKAPSASRVTFQG